jgi:septum site-determining protein MinD
MATPAPTSSGSAPAPAAAPKPAAAHPPASRLIVVFGTKGGIGKTVVATNLAVSLAKRTGKPVCLVDLDIMAMGDVAKMLGLNVARSVVDLVPMLKAASSPGLVLLDGVLAPHGDGVHVLQCLAHLRQLTLLDPKALTPLFALLKQRYEYVIVDGGKAFSEPLITAFDAANLILLVTSPDLISLYQTKEALQLLESLLFPSTMVRAVLNRAESRGGVGRQEVLAALPCEVIGEIPSDGRIVGTATNQGVPIPTAFGYTKVAEAFGKLAAALASRAELYVLSADGAEPARPPEATAALASGASTMWSPRLYTAQQARGANGAPEEAVDEFLLMKRRIHEKLVDELNLKRLDLAGMGNNTSQMLELRTKTEGVIANLLAREMSGVAISREQRVQLVKEIADEALGLGCLEELLADPTVTDILVNNKDQVYVERRGKLELSGKRFVSNDQVRAIIERIITPLGRRIDESSPMVDARLADGSRVNAIIPPLALKGPSLSIRKFSNIRYSHEDLIKIGSLTPVMAQFIRAAVIARKNMIVSGGTGSGKTTMLNIVSAFIPDDERIITIEDAAELRLAQPHVVSLEARPPSVEGKGTITIRDLFRNTLRMRPDRIVIGECRGAETLDMLQAMNTGHDGSITTVHANSPKDVIARLDSLVLMSGVELPVATIRQMVASAIHLIVHTARLSDGTRKVMAISEVHGLSRDNEILFQDIFLFRQTGVSADGKVIGYHTATGQRPSFFTELKAKGIAVDESFFVPAKPTLEGAAPSVAPTVAEIEESKA